ncbi:MAG TPA: hypothetical protein ENG74_00950 [Thermoplasmatales archaeon]|nr:hypothetical protein [Thermoplasmatales archaeon]
MGFSLTGTHIVFFIAAVIVAGAVSGIFTAITMDISSSLSNKCDRLKERLDTDFKIINDPDNIPNAGGYYLFYIKNTGSKKLETTNDTFQVLIDGDIVSKSNYKFSSNSVQSTEVVTLYVATSEISSGTHKLRLVGPRGVDDEFTFTV